MTDKEKLDKLVAEIKRRIAFFNEQSVRKTTTDDNSCALALQGVLCFYDSMQEEPVSEQNLSNVERTGKNWKESVSEDLETEIDNISDKYRGLESLCEHDVIEICEHFFKFGAQWQKAQMMKDATEGLVICDEFLTHGLKDIVMKIPKNLQVNDKVKVIIIKEG